MLIQSKPSAKYEIIKAMSERDNNLLNIQWLCAIAGVSRSGYYYWLSTEKDRNERDKQDRSDFDLILEAFRYRGYNKGARGIHMRLLLLPAGYHEHEENLAADEEIPSDLPGQEGKPLPRGHEGCTGITYIP